MGGQAVGRRVREAEVAKQEAETATLNAKLARMERELGLLRKILHGFIEVHMIYHDRGQI